MESARASVGIFVFDDVEVLDFAGPFEVFSRTRLVPGVESRRTEDSAPFSVFTVGVTRAPVLATGGLQLVPAFGFADAPAIDLLLVPGGFGTRRLLADDAVLDWVAASAAKAQLVTSVCTGALLLARTGLLRNRRATTHWAALDLLAALDPTLIVERGVRSAGSGPITSAGVSAGIDMALDVVERLHGKAVADETAHYMEYRRAAALASA
jgi:transcriptional regulator GlxA family with amidase domain